MYAFHRSRRDPLYTNYAIYSPEVPVFRSDDGSLLDEPYTVGIITSPAVNARQMAPERKGEIGPAMWLRILKVLSIGVKHGHDSIVLGAWGCGAFGNDGHEIAALFRKALEQNFKGAYRQVIFAIVGLVAESEGLLVPFKRLSRRTEHEPDERRGIAQMNSGGFSWKRFTGMSAAKSRISRSIGIPLTKSGREQKIGRIFTGGGCLVIVCIGAFLALAVPAIACLLF